MRADWAERSRRIMAPSDKPPPKRRFIAGAVCPECRAVDRLVVYGEPGAQQRECIECGFTDSVDRVVASSEPRNRLRGERPVNTASDTTAPVQTVRILEPSPAPSTPETTPEEGPKPDKP